MGDKVHSLTEEIIYNFSYFLFCFVSNQKESLFEKLNMPNKRRRNLLRVCVRVCVYAWERDLEALVEARLGSVEILEDLGVRVIDVALEMVEAWRGKVLEIGDAAQGFRSRRQRGVLVDLRGRGRSLLVDEDSWSRRVVRKRRSPHWQWRFQKLRYWGPAVHFLLHLSVSFSH